MKKVLIICLYSFLLLHIPSLSVGNEKEVSRNDLTKLIKRGLKLRTNHLYDSAIVILKKAEHESIRINDTYMQCLAINNQGLVRMSQERYYESIDLYKNAIALYPDSVIKRNNLQAMLNIAISYRRLSDLKNASIWLDKAQAYASNLPNGKELGSCLNELGIINKMRGDLESAINFFKKSLQVRREIGYKKGVATSLNNIANCLRIKGQLQESLEYYSEALELKKELGSKKSLSSGYTNLGELLIQLEDLKKAKENLLNALRIKEEINDKSGMVSTCTLLGELNIRKKHYKEAEYYLLRGKNLSEEIGALNLMKETYQKLKDLYLAKEEYDKMTTYYDRYVEVKDSIFNVESMKSINELETRYQTREKEQQIKVLNIEKEAKANESFYMKIVLGVFLFSLLPIGFFVKQRQKTRILKERVAASNRECTKLGMELHDSISGSLTYLYRSMEKESVGESFVDQLRQVSDEVRGISHQLNMTAIANQEFRDALSDSLQLDHFPEDIDLKIYVPDGFEIDDYEKKINLIRIVQELKTNSLKHGNAYSIVISFSRLQNKVRLDYSDNGIGFDMKEAKKGNGLINIQERVELLSGKLDWQTSLGNGVSFHLTV